MTTALRRRSAALAGAALVVAGLAACATDAAPASTLEPSAPESSETTDAPEATETDAASPTEITVVHPQGETVVPVNPATVLTFDLAALGTLDALGVTVAGVPKSNLPGELERFAGEEFLDIGTLFEPDFEAVNAAEPDLIIVAGRSSAALPELDKIAPTIDLSNDWASFYESNLTNTRILGEVFDKTEVAESLIADLDARIAAVKAKAADAGNALIVLTSGGEVTAYGPGSRFGILHDTLGVTPAVEDVEEATHGEAISFEFILETNPDWLFVVDRDAATGEGGAAAAEVLDNELVAQTTAAKEGQIVYVDSVAWYILNGGVPALDTILSEVEGALG